MTRPTFHAHPLPFLVFLAFLTPLYNGLAQQSQGAVFHRRFEIIGKDSAGKPTVREISDTTSEPPPLPFDTLKVGQNWSKLQKGLTESEVEQLLGVPPKIQYDETHFYWWYGNRAVIFNVATKKVAGWDD